MSVITILPGDPLYSSFGHTAIRVRDDSSGLDVGYNYGTFDFEEEGFYLKFLEGKLDYVLGRNRFEDVIWAYQTEQRPIIEQQLNFSLDQRQELFDRLEINYLPENRAYRYEFLYDNCSTRPRDIIEAAWGFRMEGDGSHETDTFRDLIDRYLGDKPWTRFGIDIVIGARTDIVASPRERMFLPDEFLAAIDRARTPDGLRLSTPPDTLYWPEGYTRGTGALPWPGIFGWGLLFVVATLSVTTTNRMSTRKLLRQFEGLLFFLMGIAGIVVALLWFATEHTVTKSNWNLLWALPTHVWLGITLLRDRRPAWLAGYLWLTLGLIAVIAVGHVWIPQEFNPWLIPFLGIVLIRSAINIKPSRI